MTGTDENVQNAQRASNFCRLAVMCSEAILLGGYASALIDHVGLVIQLLFWAGILLGAAFIFAVAAFDHIIEALSEPRDSDGGQPQ